MLQFPLWKKILVIAVAVAAVLFALPNVMSDDTGTGISWLPGKSINLGLDLQGGSHLLLRVDINAVERERLDDLAENVRRDLRGARIKFSGLRATQDSVILQIRDTTKLDAAATELATLGQDFVVKFA